MSDHAIFTVAKNWETVTPEERQPLKELVTKLVGYPCQLACKINDDAVDIYVFSNEKKKVTDWLELQSNGAIGVIFDFYKKDPEALCDRCDDYNTAINVVFESESGSDSESGSGSE